MRVDELLKEPSNKDPLWWLELAECVDKADLFMNPGNGRTQKAKEVCDSCLAQNVCFWRSIACEVNDEDFTEHNLVFGGYSGNERKHFVSRYHVTTDHAWAQYLHERTKLWLHVTREPG